MKDAACRLYMVVQNSSIENQSNSNSSFPRFQVASHGYYASQLEPTFVKLKEKLKEKNKTDNPATNAISLDGWSENHEGLDSTFSFIFHLCETLHGMAHNLM